jgi:membrane fusion protein (multidrug efflux system)
VKCTLRAAIGAASIALMLTAGPGCARKFEKQGGPPPDAKLPVITHIIQPEPFTEQLVAAASLAARESVTLKSEAEGRVVAIEFAEGERVEAGRVMFRLDAEKLEAALREAEAGFALADANRIRAEEMFRANTISAQEYDAAVSAYNARQAAVALLRKQLQDSVIRAPFSGVAGERLVSPGQVVGRLAPLGSLVDLDAIRVEFRVPERFAHAIAPGQTVVFQTPAWPDTAFTGRVYFVSPELDALTRTLLVKAETPNPDGRLKPGMFGIIRLAIREYPDALMVPDIAVIRRGDKAYVYVVNSDRRAELREVRLGERISGRVRVLDGIRAGDEVITEGHQKVDPGTPVEAT